MSEEQRQEPDWYSVKVASALMRLSRDRRVTAAGLARILAAYEAARPPAGTTLESFDGQEWMTRYLAS